MRTSPESHRLIYQNGAAPIQAEADKHAPVELFAKSDPPVLFFSCTDAELREFRGAVHRYIGEKAYKTCEEYIWYSLRRLGITDFDVLGQFKPERLVFAIPPEFRIPLAQILADLGEVYRQKGPPHFFQRICVLEQAVGLDPEHVFSRLKLSDAYCRVGAVHFVNFRATSGTEHILTDEQITREIPKYWKRGAEILENLLTKNLGVALTPDHAPVVPWFREAQERSRCLWAVENLLTLKMHLGSWKMQTDCNSFGEPYLQQALVLSRFALWLNGVSDIPIALRQQAHRDPPSADPRGIRLLIKANVAIGRILEIRNRPDFAELYFKAAKRIDPHLNTRFVIEDLCGVLPDVQVRQLYRERLRSGSTSSSDSAPRLPPRPEEHR